MGLLAPTIMSYARLTMEVINNLITKLVLVERCYEL